MLLYRNTVDWVESCEWCMNVIENSLTKNGMGWGTDFIGLRSWGLPTYLDLYWQPNWCRIIIALLHRLYYDLRYFNALFRWFLLFLRHFWRFLIDILKSSMIVQFRGHKLSRTPKKFAKSRKFIYLLKYFTFSQLSKFIFWKYIIAGQ